MNSGHSCREKMLHDCTESMNRRPSGNPSEDFTQAAGAAIRISTLQEFEKVYAEVSFACVQHTVMVL